ncbi:MAG TPA: YfhO family protein [Acidimicrobiales bacterium]|nr:YfhO family protein [Acidimicrobiales bacterium]
MPRVVREVAGLAVVAVAAFAVMAPALRHGASLGPYDVLNQMGLSKAHGPVHPTLAYDQIKELIPWTALSWTQVHQGHLPLWNPYSVLGMPLAFNWQSAAFALPTLVGYALPLHLAYTAAVLTTLLLAGAGAYVLGRVLGCGVMASAFAGAVFELSGGFMIWLGWPIASVMSWAGWILAAIVLVLRGTHRFRAWLMLAVALALAVYAGQVDALVPLMVGVAVFAGAAVIVRHRQQRAPRRTGRSVLDLASAAVTAGLLSGPLLFPGLQLTRLSVRNSSGGVALHGHDALPAGVFTNLAFVGWNRLYVRGSLEALGVLVVVLAIAGVVTTFRRPEVVGLVAVVLFCILIAFVPPVVSWLAGFPGLQAVRASRSIVLLMLAVVALAALGLARMLRSLDAAVAWRVAGGFVVAGVVLVVLWRVGLHGHPGSTPALRWAAVECGVGFAGAGALWLVARRWGRGDPRARGAARAVAGAFIVCASAFLVWANDGVWSSSPTGFVATPAEAALKRIVGSSVVGIGVQSKRWAYLPQIGILANANVGLGIDEMCVYDPLTPSSYFKSWLRQYGVIGGYVAISTFCPAVTSVGQAQLYGVSYILEPPGDPGPPGTQFVTSLAGEGLFRVPGAAVATLTPADQGMPATDAPGTPVAAVRPDPATLRVTTDAATPDVLRLRLTNLPGWHASIDGRPLPLQPFGGVMLQARVPPGRHVIEVRYWPETFSAGLAAASLGVVVVGCVGAATGVRRRRRVRPGAAPGATL